MKASAAVERWEHALWQFSQASDGAKRLQSVNGAPVDAETARRPVVELLNEAGGQGWQVVGIEAGGMRYLLKRPVRAGVVETR